VAPAAVAARKKSTTSRDRLACTTWRVPSANGSTPVSPRLAAGALDDDFKEKLREVHGS